MLRSLGHFTPYFEPSRPDGVQMAPQQRVIDMRLPQPRSQACNATPQSALVRRARANQIRGLCVLSTLR